jgi:hypothetical protein
LKTLSELGVEMISELGAKVMEMISELGAGVMESNLRAWCRSDENT